MSTSFGNIIKHWRNIRRFSQLALSAESGLSSRHISFLETGRSRPSRGSVLTLARVLDMPKHVVNDALLAVGFSPEYLALDIGDVDLAPMMDAMTTILENHAPMPAIIINSAWQIVGGNTSAMHLMQFLPMHGSMSVVDALINDDPETPIFLNWDEIAAWTLLRLQVESVRTGRQGPLMEVYNRLIADPRLANKDLASFSDSGPYLTLQARVGEHTLSLFTMLAEFTTAQDINMSERRVELFFPENAETEAYFMALR
ncbi:putative XRE family helix-turn-helix protein [Octadecabacter antarcticus 307]|uniref:Putative XRE family helix-turn-helix protein n=1 Tax=Octadecabacter antarcticus 307 TaxID=391626 RepID=M9REW2_9RHOB|nr:helix-turn-helix transcriptional regulator [Octadecabacter antarcticus]AGI68921.1 putative XRE family helix-turn-helix protein [Octadecabacter antarcticus 307]